MEITGLNNTGLPNIADDLPAIEEECEYYYDIKYGTIEDPVLVVKVLEVLHDNDDDDNNELSSQTIYIFCDRHKTTY